MNNFQKENFESIYPNMADDIQWNIVGATVIKTKEAMIAYCNKMMVEMANSTLNTTNHIVGDNVIASVGLYQKAVRRGPRLVFFTNRIARIKPKQRNGLS